VTLDIHESGVRNKEEKEVEEEEEEEAVQVIWPIFVCLSVWFIVCAFIHLVVVMKKTR